MVQHWRTSIFNGIENRKKISSEHRNKYQWNLYKNIYNIQIYIQDIDKNILLYKRE